MRLEPTMIDLRSDTVTLSTEAMREAWRMRSWETTAASAIRP